MSGDGCCCHDLERERSGASELEDAYAEAMGALNRVTAQRDAARDIAARLEAQLAAVADLHRPQPIYDECERDCPDHGIPLNYYTGCPDRIVAMACRHCCLDANGDQTEDCATYHDHTEHTCPTAAALAIPDDDTDPDAVIAEGES